MKKIKSYIKNFKTCKSFYPDGPVKSHTPRFQAVDKETIQRNFLCKLLSSFYASTNIAESNYFLNQNIQFFTFLSQILENF